jgi:long-chain acyl-CoA synthetase
MDKARNGAAPQRSAVRACLKPVDQGAAMLRLERRTLSELALAAAARYGSKKIFSVVGEGGERDELSYVEFGRRVRAFARALGEIGVKPGDRVMILAENRPEWPTAYFGIAVAGAVSVPVLTDFIPEHVASVASHAEVSAICATAKTLPKLAEAGIDPSIPVIRLDEMTADGVSVAAGGSVRTIALADAEPVHRPEEDDLASIIYTSGTTGKSKGVMLAHKSIVFDAAACRSIIKLYPRDRFLSVLPLAHTYECTIGMVIAVLNGSSVAYLDRPPTPTALLPALHEIRPTIMLTVPLIIEKIYRNRIGPALEAHPLYKLPLTRGIAIKAAGRKLLGTFGGAIRFFGVGGAALAPEVEAFLKKADFPYAIGYGLTETAPLLAGAGPFKTVLRSTGPALEGVDLRIVDAEGRIVAGVGAPKGGIPWAEGEIQGRGPNVMLGYYKDEERTREVFTPDGWFRTGDLGCFDEKGRLFIRGRLKAMILGPSGENIYPEEIESILNASGLVEESLVYAGEKGELVALVVLNEKARTLMAAAGDAAGDAMEGAKEAFGRAAEGAGNAAKAMGERAGELLGDLKANANKRLAAFSRIHRVEVHHEPFEKTATQKIKRFLYPKKKQ